MQELSMFAQRLDQSAEKFKEVRREALSEAGDQLLGMVRGQIGGHGKVQRWQGKFMGSGGGYAAVRPVSGEMDENGYSVGYVTNAIEGGHKQKTGRYVPALKRTLKQSHVPGKYMYQQTARSLDRIAKETADKIGREMIRFLGE